MAETRVFRIAVILVLAFVAARGTAESGGKLRLFVFKDSPKQPLKGVPVTLLARSGSRNLGMTDADGYVEVRKADLIDRDSMALLFCFENSSTACSALRLDDGSVARYDELAVNIPLPKTVDTFPVRPNRP